MIVKLIALSDFVVFCQDFVQAVKTVQFLVAKVDLQVEKKKAAS
jgi:hypothetical protein